MAVVGEAEGEELVKRKTVRVAVPIVIFLCAPSPAPPDPPYHQSLTRNEEPSGADRPCRKAQRRRPIPENPIEIVVSTQKAWSMAERPVNQFFQHHFLLASQHPLSYFVVISISQYEGNAPNNEGNAPSCNEAFGEALHITKDIKSGAFHRAVDMEDLKNRMNRIEQRTQILTERVVRVGVLMEEKKKTTPKPKKEREKNKLKKEKEVVCVEVFKGE